MFKIGNQGNFETLPDHAMAIYKGDAAPVEEFFKQGIELEKEISLSEYIALTPLDLALITNQQAVVKLLGGALIATFEDFLAKPEVHLESLLN
ncbi:hypothetical protein [Paenibacillus pabuli]|uniref:hypothetical protein n=1 Tax=Paenibacillus pabuli TaxID=1472 RepID=UPI003CF669BF